MNEDKMRDITDVCRMLSEATRFSIVEILIREPKSVGEFCRKLGLAQPAVSHHLGLLRRTKVVGNKRGGRRVIYSLNRKRLAPLKDLLKKIR